MTRQLKCILNELVNGFSNDIDYAIELAKEEHLTLSDITELLIDYISDFEVGFGYVICNSVLTDSNREHIYSFYEEETYDNYFNSLIKYEQDNYITTNGFSVKNVVNVLDKYMWKTDTRHKIVFIDFCENKFGVEIIDSVERGIEFIANLIGHFSLDYNIKDYE